MNKTKKILLKIMLKIEEKILIMTQYLENMYKIITKPIMNKIENV